MTADASCCPEQTAAGLGISVDILGSHTAERPHIRRDLPHFMVVQNPPARRHFRSRNALPDYQKQGPIIGRASKPRLSQVRTAASRSRRTVAHAAVGPEETRTALDIHRTGIRILPGSLKRRFGLKQPKREKQRQKRECQWYGHRLLERKLRCARQSRGRREVYTGPQARRQVSSIMLDA